MKNKKNGWKDEEGKQRKGLLIKTNTWRCLFDVSACQTSSIKHQTDKIKIKQEKIKDFTFD